MGQESLKELVKAHENAELGKGPRKPTESKLAKDAQKEINGTKEPMSNAIQSLNDHIELLRGERVVDPKRPSRLGSNNIIAGVATGMAGNARLQKRTKEWAE